MAKQLKPDIVLMDIGMPNLNGAQATRRVKNQTPDTKVLVLTRHDDSGYLKKLLEEGADGYVLKQGASSVLIGAVRQVAAGNGFLDPAMAVGMVSQIAKRHPVSGEDIIEVLGERETSVLRLTALGYSVKEIATRLEIGPKTVENARSAVTRKLGLSSRVEIVQYAVRQGWMKDD